MDKNNNTFELLDLDSAVDTFDELADSFLECVSPELTGKIAFGKKLFKLPGTIRDIWLLRKFAYFLKTIREKDLGASVKYSEQFFGDKEKAKENIMLLVQYIDKAETLTIIDYMVNASRAAGNQLITEQEYYRILWALTNTFPSDLHYFRTMAIGEEPIPGNTKIIGLAQSGLMITAGMDGKKTPEDQDYVVTKFGKLVDMYALSLDEEERYQKWKKQGEQADKNFSIGIKFQVDDGRLMVDY